LHKFFKERLYVSFIPADLSHYSVHENKDKVIKKWICETFYITFK